MFLYIRFGMALAVPIDQDAILIGTVSGIRLGKASLSSVSVSPKALEYVDVRVNGTWYVLGECGLIDDDLQIVSLEHYGLAKLG